MNILALDTVTECCSAALMLDGRITARREVARTRHAELILPMVESLLAEAGIGLGALDAVAFDRGPGSFTGVRIGTGVAQGIAFAAGLPVCGISSLAALAVADGRCNVLAAIDARMKQVYWGLVRDPEVAHFIEERLDDPENVRVDVAGVHGVGSGWDTYAPVLSSVVQVADVTPECFPEARWIAVLAGRTLRDRGGVRPDDVTPVYLRDRVTN